MDDTRDYEGSGTGGLATSDNQRSARRFSLLLRTAKLVYPDAEFLCIVRDVSASGVRLRCFHPLPAGKAAELELANGVRHPLEWVWEENGHAGFRFPAKIDVRGFVNEASHWSRRPIRLGLRLPAVLLVDTMAKVAWLYNLSQHGARIECSQRLAVGQKVRLEAEGLPPLIANVAWQSSPCYGLVFHQSFTFEALAILAAKVQSGEGPALLARRIYEGRNSRASPFMQ